MKNLLFPCLILAVLPAAVFGQGTVYFYNHVPSVGLDAPVFNTDGQTPLTGANFVAQLYGGPDAKDLLPIGDLAVFAGSQPGYWVSFGSSLDRTIPTVAPGAEAFVQVRVWSTQLGSTYDQVEAAGGKHGESSVFSVITGGVTQGGTLPPTFPAFLTDLKSFSLTGIEPDIPEPGTGLLFLLGGGLVFLRLIFRHQGSDTPNAASPS
jgi:hypothetical protein